MRTPQKLTAMHHAHIDLGATFLDRDGWKLPGKYSSIEAEVAQTIGIGGICDISPLGKLTFQGNDVLGQLSTIMGLPEQLSVGETKTCRSPVANGDNAKPVAISGLAYDEVMVATSLEAKGSVEEYLGARLEHCAHMIDLTSSWAGLIIIGPKSREALSRLLDLDLDLLIFTNGSCAQGKAAGVSVLVVRSDVSDHVSYQVYVTRDYGEYLWHALIDAIKKLGMGAIGIEALEQISSGSSDIPW